MTLLYILLGIIAYILWRIYRQREEEKEAIADAKFEADWEAKKKEEFKDYPHLYGKLEGNWLEVFSHHQKEGIPLLKVMFFLMLGESTKIDYSDGSMKYDALWNITKELLEHLEKYHEGTVAEHEIALATYWQIAATRMGELIKERPNTGSLSSGAHTAEIEGSEVEKAPFTDIEKIAALFPKNHSHPPSEITFFNPDGSFPRESTGSTIVAEKMRALGL
ncbi:MAG TPA: hypothetical protein VHC20_02895 [Candidatus Paceibacterota bacterium]|nr:hypothetical protein [Candidatus Paceibacterota bacterium]